MNTPLRLSLGVLSLTAALAACGQQTTPPHYDPPGQHVNALTLGDVGGAVVSKLQNTNLEKYSGAQDLSTYDLLVVDGDSSTADTIKTHPLIKRALALHKPMLFVDVTEDHKRNGIGKLIGFSTKGNSAGYLVVPVQSSNGRSFYHLYGTSPVSDAASSSTSVNVQQAANSTASDDLFAAKLAGNIAAAQQTSGGLQDTPNGIGPIQAKWVYTTSETVDLPPTGLKKKSGQVANATANYTYTLFQDLSTNLSTGGTQILTVSTDATADPGPMVSDDTSDRGWLTGVVQVSTSMTDAGTSGLSWLQSAPTAQNNATTYSSGTSFNVGFEGFAGSGSFGYDTSKSWTINDWSVQGNISGNNLTWRFKSANPNVDDVCKHGIECSWFPLGGTQNVAHPNALSTSQSEYHTEVAYQNAQISTDAISLDSQVDVRFDNFYEKGAPTEYDHAYHDYVMDNPASINLAAVAPNPVNLITFNYNVAPTNTQASVTGTVTLQSPAVTDTQVYLQAVSTSSNNVTVPFSEIVPAGQTSAPFSISLNGESNDGSSQDSSVTVTALYGKTYSQVLKTHTYGANDLQPPTTAPTPDNGNWGATTNAAPTGSLWQPGYQVRYAVSFVDAQGNEARGPWTDWFNFDTSDASTYYALPLLEQIPTDPSNNAVARRVYRQFYSEALAGKNPDGLLIQPDANGNSIADNTQVGFRDNTW